jgi:integrase
MGKASRHKSERRSVPLPPEAQEAIKRQFAAFREKFGREPGPDDPVFFDPVADTPIQMPEEIFRTEMNRAAAAAGIDPAWIYAMNKTGMMVTEMNKHQWSERDLAEWDAAIEEYRSQISKPPV